MNQCCYSMVTLILIWENSESLPNFSYSSIKHINIEQIMYLHYFYICMTCGYCFFSHVDKIHHGTSTNLGILLQYSATCTSGFIVAFIANWRLTLFMLPLFFLCLVAPHLLDKVCFNNSITSCCYAMMRHTTLFISTYLTYKQF